MAIIKDGSGVTTKDGAGEEIKDGSPAVEGEVIYGHDTAVTEFNVKDFLGNITAGLGYRILGSGDAERVELESNGYFELETWEFGVMFCELIIDKYGLGSGSYIVRYKDGDSEANCDLDSWNLYTAPFPCTGWVKTRVEAA